VVGRDPDVPSFFWLAGQGGFGIMTAPALARIAAGLIMTRDSPPGPGLDATRLGPARLRPYARS
jgi:D-arginine dehydrogenase